MHDFRLRGRGLERPMRTPREEQEVLPAGRVIPRDTQVMAPSWLAFSDGLAVRRLGAGDQRPAPWRDVVMEGWRDLIME
ncbi:hypothetical protein EYF80_035594 [Liparis tanakae]|uniref:Uncharacterized protein n=1 Tax=Liparis tanakae TaxID=230148 RepID=A0A4Z2GL11_9TELE|nr:hypothetical protein EYF80_035594 [Liparis tanakae]